MGEFRSVLLTGSRGFTGLHLRKVLTQAGYRVAGLVRSQPAADEVEGDLSSVPSLVDAVRDVRPELVVHLAAIAYVGHADPLDFYKVNLCGTLNLLQALDQSRIPVRKVILASSSNVYGISPVIPVGEDAIPAPVNHYAMSKLAMEYMSRNWLNRLPIVITRPFNYTGPGQSETFLVPKIVSHFVRKESKIRLGNLDVQREFNDVRTVAYGYKVLLEDAPPGSVVNICTGVGHCLTDVLKLAERITGFVLEVDVDPALVRANELPVLVGNPDRFNSMVKDAPAFSLEETLTSMIHQYSRYNQPSV
jgi:nucleoside-diphosphate-sugar epimerase